MNRRRSWLAPTAGTFAPGMPFARRLFCDYKTAYDSEKTIGQRHNLVNFEPIDFIFRIRIALNRACMCTKFHGNRVKID